MIKKLKPVIIMGSVALALIIIYVLLRVFLPSVENSDEKVNSIEIFNFQANSVLSCQIDNKKDSYTILRKVEKTYKIKGKEDCPVDDTSVYDFLEEFSSLSAVKLIEENSEKLDDYGLQEAGATMVVSTKNKNYKIEIGNESTSGSYYFKLGDNNNVYLLDSDFAEKVLNTRNQFYDSSFSKYSSDDEKSLMNITFFGKLRNETVKIKQVATQDEQQEDGIYTHQIISPISHPYSTAHLSALTGMLSSLSTATVVSDDVSDKSLEKYGLKDPNYAVTYTLTGGDETLLIGKSAQNDQTYVMIKGRKLINKIDDTTIACVKNGLKSMCEPITYQRDVDTISSIRILSDKKNYSIALSGTGENTVAKINGKTVLQENFAEFYAHIISIKAGDVDTMPKNAKALVTLEITTKDGERETVKYYNINERKCLYTLNGEGIFTVDRSSVENIVSNAQKLYNEQPIVQEW